MDKVTVRKQMPSTQLDRAEFDRRFRQHFADPAFAPLASEIARITDAAWGAYEGSRKSSHTVPAGPGFADPKYELSAEWIDAHRRIAAAEARQRDAASPSRILLINGAARSENTCPGESSKTYRLTELARAVFAEDARIEIDVLDLSRVVSEFGRTIHPCKTCVSTAMPLCHWPCSCYPNHALGQIHDWMNDIYPMWAAAHGIMLVCPVNWYGPPSVVKLMMDRLVCADGGNPDPTSTGGKDAEKAKRLELEGWDYPRHLAGRVFSVVVHGDAAGAHLVRDEIGSWLTDIGLLAAGRLAQVESYIGYKEPYATSHDALDADAGMQDEVRVAARSLRHAVQMMRDGRSPPEPPVKEARPK